MRKRNKVNFEKEVNESIKKAQEVRKYYFTCFNCFEKIIKLIEVRKSPHNREDITVKETELKQKYDILLEKLDSKNYEGDFNHYMQENVGKYLQNGMQHCYDENWERILIKEKKQAYQAYLIVGEEILLIQDTLKCSEFSYALYALTDRRGAYKVLLEKKGKTPNDIVKYIRKNNPGDYFEDNSEEEIRYLLSEISSILGCREHRKGINHWNDMLCVLYTKDENSPVTVDEKFKEDWCQIIEDYLCTDFMHECFVADNYNRTNIKEYVNCMYEVGHLRQEKNKGA